VAPAGAYGEMLEMAARRGMNGEAAMQVRWRTSCNQPSESAVLLVSSWSPLSSYLHAHVIAGSSVSGLCMRACY
jgi:hypothetical protein